MFTMSSVLCWNRLFLDKIWLPFSMEIKQAGASNSLRLDWRTELKKRLRKRTFVVKKKSLNSGNNSKWRKKRRKRWLSKDFFNFISVGDWGDSVQLLFTKLKKKGLKKIKLVSINRKAFERSFQNVFKPSFNSSSFASFVQIIKDIRYLKRDRRQRWNLKTPIFCKIKKNR